MNEEFKFMVASLVLNIWLKFNCEEYKVEIGNVYDLEIITANDILSKNGDITKIKSWFPSK